MANNTRGLDQYVLRPDIEAHNKGIDLCYPFTSAGFPVRILCGDPRAILTLGDRSILFLGGGGA